VLVSSAEGPIFASADRLIFQMTTISPAADDMRPRRI
jgi:hypothetical protein